MNLGAQLQKKVSWGRNPPRSLTDHKFNAQTGVRFKIRTNEEPFHLFAIHCKDYETTEVLEREAQKMSNLLLSNEHPKVSNEHGYYQKSHYDILESRTKKVDHDFWKGRQLKSVYTLDIEFVEKTLSGQVHHKLIKPISPRNQSLQSTLGREAFPQPDPLQRTGGRGTLRGAGTAQAVHWGDPHLFP